MVEVVNKNNFESFISEGLVLVDFFAVWCGPCKMLAPIVTKLSEQFEGKIKCGKLDTDNDVDIAMKFDISAIPCLLLFKDGKLIDKSIGYVDYEELKKLVEKYI